MTMEKVLGIVWDVMNSPAGITAMAGVFLWLLNRLYAKKPLWKRFEGSIISAVRFAEKEIPDDTPGKGLARLNAALKYVLRVYEEAKGRKADAGAVHELKEGIQVVHDRLDTAGTL